LRFFYADPGLRDRHGHHGNICRAVVRELRSRGIAPTVFASDRIDDTLRADLEAVPLFRHFSYLATDGDPVNGWRHVFELGTRLTTEDLARLPEIGAGDILFCYTAMPVMLLSLAQWMAARPPDSRPQIVVELGTDTGLDPAPAGDGSFVARDPQVDARAVLYRHAAAQIPKDAASHLHLFYVDARNAEIFTQLLQYPVRVLPSFHAAYGPPHRRGTKRPLTIGVLGHQQMVKGYHLVPEVALRVLFARSECRFIVHNSVPQQLPDLQNIVRMMAETQPRLVVDERTVAPEIWAGLLETIDIALCPYDPTHYRMMPSGIVADAVANAIPFVGPAGTSVARMQSEYQAGGSLFEGYAPEPIAAATIAVLDTIERQADLSLAAATRWAAGNGVRHAVDTILATAGVTAPR
jgi:hypothetical protein